MEHHIYKLWGFVMQYSILLVSGSIFALVWANVSHESYTHFNHLILIDDFFIGHLHVDATGNGHRTLTLHYLVNDVLMALFFAVAGKEVWEALILEDGSLRGSKAVTPLFATVGGVVGPVAVYLSIASLLGSTTFEAVSNGWAVPTATDIAFSYLVGRIIFGRGHPAVGFLLLLAIADDALGLMILAVFYPTGDLELQWLVLSVGVCIAAFVFFNWLPRKLDKGKQHRPHSTWVRRKFAGLPYICAGCVSWYGFQESGLHPALGLLPVIPAIPHSDRDFGFFDEAEEHLHDVLNELEHLLKYPVEIILALFGLMNAGVQFSAVGSTTFLVLAGLLIGKPFGIMLFAWIASRHFGLGLPEGMSFRDVCVVGCVAGIGFTVALFVSSVAFPAGEIQDAVKMGAVLSFFGVIISVVVAKVVGVERITD